MAGRRRRGHDKDVLRAMGVEKAYGDVVALRGVDLDVDAGSIVALLGRNGAGKTTLLSVVAGLLQADRGSVEIGGIDAARDPDGVARLIGIAPQQTGIYPVLTVRQNLEFFCDLAGVGRDRRRRRSEEVADRLGLGDLLDRKGGQLSGGEARRLHTACALVHHPRLLMLDEPTVGADVETRHQLIESVRSMADEGVAVIYTTHYLPEVEALDADIVIIDDGRVLARGTRAELIERHHRGGVRVTIEGEDDGHLDGLGAEVVEVVEMVDRPPGRVTVYRILQGVGIADLVNRFGDDTDRLVSVEREQPGLEGVFLTVTGHTLAEGDGEGGGRDPEGVR